MKNFLFVLSISLLLSGCSASVEGGSPIDNLGKVIPPAPSPAPTPVTNCINYSGTYQMNSDYFRIDQNDCAKVTWVNLTGNQTQTEYVVDGEPRTVAGKEITAKWDQLGRLNLLSKHTTGESLLSVLSYQTKPCMPSNPDGENYLTRDVFISGKWDYDRCDFWLKH